MRRFSVLLVLACFVWTYEAWGGLVSYTQERVGCIGSPDTIPGSGCPVRNTDFALSFTNLATPAPFSPALIVMEAFGDFSSDVAEFLIVNFDSLFTANAFYANGGVDYVTVEKDFFLITAQQLSAALVDHTFRLGIHMDEVDAYDGIFDPRRESYVRASLTYLATVTVSEPESLWLLLPGLGLLIAKRRADRKLEVPSLLDG